MNSDIEHGEIPLDLDIDVFQKVMDDMNEYTLKAFGRRPIDWIKRDLLIGAALRHRENWMYRKLLRNRPFSVPLPAEEDLPGQAKIIEEGIAFELLHKMHLSRMKAAAERMANREQFRFLRMNACPSSFWLTSRINKWVHRNCNHSWLCPHCYARNAVKCIDRMNSAISPSTCGFLLLFEAFHTIDCGNTLSIRSKIAELRSSLILLARRFGGSGGIWSTQVIPEESLHQSWDAEDQYIVASEICQRIRVAVAAIVPPSNDKITAFAPLLAGDIDLNSALSTEAEELLADALPFHGPSTVRAIAVQPYPDSHPRQRLRNCRYGLFTWPPIWSLNVPQWQLRAEVLFKHKTYSHWGTLRNGGLDFIPQVEHSECASYSTVERRNHLLKAAQDYSANKRHRNGKLLGRNVIRRALEESGHVVSDRDARWIVRQLNAISFTTQQGTAE